MCGIAGILSFDGSVTREELLRLNRYNIPRGPDGEGYLIKQNIGFAHRRLSIIDLSENASQPMEDNERNVFITFNGEIYNHNILRKELLSLGFSFESRSDTEVILKGYSAWGIDLLLEKLDGMFAFALADINQGKIFLCRDPFGKKPFYYFLDNKKLIFSSDLRSIRESENLTLNFGALDYYLTELSSPQPQTIFNEVMQVPPGTRISINISNGKIESKSFWQINYNNKTEAGENEILDQTESLLISSIKKRLTGDVPVASFLSGGADSGLITALYAANSSQKISTYSVGFSYQKYNELPLAKSLAKKYSTNHTEILLEAIDMNCLDDVLNAFPEPFADSSAIPSFLISQIISRTEKVALSGDGGDEMFGGYFEYPLLHKTELFEKQYKNKVDRLIAVNTSKVLSRLKLTEENLGTYETYLKQSPAEIMYRQMGFSTQEKMQLYNPELLNYSSSTENVLLTTWNESISDSRIDTFSKASLKTRLLNDYLVKVDRTSMAHGLEVRSPFLDKELSCFAASIPNGIKYKLGESKYILKKLATKYIDPHFFSREKKGFSIPLAEWLRKELRPLAEETLFSGSFERRGYFNIAFVKGLYQKHLEGKKDNSNKLWSLICLEKWLTNK